MTAKKYFIDTEFIERGPHHPIDLLSIGIVCEDGRQYYAVSNERDENDASQWVKDNVIPLLGQNIRKSLSQIADDLSEFFSPEKHGKPEFWAYYADYDWVVFCQIFGRMIDLPKDFPMFCRDVKQFAVDKGNPTLPEQTGWEHNALMDARWTKFAHEFLEKL